MNHEDQRFREAWIRFRDASSEGEVIASLVRGHLEERFRRHMPVENVLDVGCGNGNVLIDALLSCNIELEKRLQALHFVDPSPLIESAAVRASSLCDRYPLATARFFGESLSGARIESAYDVIVASHVIYYLQEAEIDDLFSRMKIGSSMIAVVNSGCSPFSSQFVADRVTRFLACASSLDLRSSRAYFEVDLASGEVSGREFASIVLAVPPSRIDEKRAREISAIADSWMARPGVHRFPLEVLEVEKRNPGTRQR